MDPRQAANVAAENGDVQGLRALVESGHNVNLADDDVGDTPLILAARNDRREAVAYLLHANAEVNSSNGFGYTPLILSAGNGYNEVVEMLVEGKAELDMKDSYGSVALVKAARYGKVDTVRLLADAKASVNAAKDDGETALIVACMNKHMLVVSYLATVAGVDVNQKSKSGDTALTLAAFSGNLELVRFLVEKAGAGIDVTGDDDKTPLEWARERKKADVVAYLTQVQKRECAPQTLSEFLKAAKITTCVGSFKEAKVTLGDLLDVTDSNGLAGIIKKLGLKAGHAAKLRRYMLESIMITESKKEGSK